MEKKYDHKYVENGKYKNWIENKIFETNVTNKNKKYSIVMPPPNVTGKLHLGHAWDGSLQDLLIRFHKLNGYDTLWVPGMDHAGIATQAKVEQRLKEKNINKYDLGREEFIKKVWEWKEEYASTIREQWSKLGLSLDYSKEKFTYSNELNKIVNHVFVEMYKKKLIYKGKKIINWDPILKTALSNIEVIYKETKGKMYHFKYFLENKKDFLEVATTRPETMFADVCVVINPTDNRYKKYINKNVINPVNGQILPVIADEYVDKNFGTGVMKCTPAHDQNDFELGLKYNLEKPICLDENGILNELAGNLKGIDRFLARDKIIEMCTKNNSFVKFEEINHQVGYSERSNAIIEPYLSNQWFVDMKKLSNQVLELQKTDNKIIFSPKRFEDTLSQWMENVHDWTISRQLWWGHQIPVYYNKNNDEIYVNVIPPIDIENWNQDEDVLDTWFSSALWPFATMEWEINKSFKDQNDLFKKYFPVDCLVTGYDIIFFWVARMIFQSLEFTKEKPFKKVLIHGLIRDENGLKMSKSLGNGIDPMEVVDEFGADALRYFLLTNSTPGQDLRFSKEKLKSSWNFLNKIWNASRYVLMNLEENFKINNNFEKDIKNSELKEDDINKWILNKLSTTSEQVKELIEKYEFTIAGKIIYDFIWSDYCNWYIELSKVNLNSDNKKNIENTKQTLVFVLKNILIMLHPFTPFITEEIYSNLKIKKFLFDEKWMTEKFKFKVNYLNEIINITNSIREFRANFEIPNSVCLNFKINISKSKYKKIINDNLDSISNYIKKIINSNLTSDINYKEEVTSIPVSDYFLDIQNSDFISKEKVKNELEKRLEELNLELVRSEKILSNKNFLEKADPIKIKNEKDKYEEYKLQINQIKTKLKKL